MSFNKNIVALAILGMVSATSANAATSIKESSFEFDKNHSTYDMSVKAQSWYNPTMGYKGWTHHSNWGFMKLTKGKPVTIEVSTDVAGLHPGLTVWYRQNNSKKIDSILNMNDHFYNQFLDIYEPNAVNNDDENNPIKIGKMYMKFVANAFDRDGMVDPLPAQFDQSRLNRAIDGTAGTVSLTFTPEENGYYQFVVGAINPDSGVSTTDRHAVQVKVSFSE